jgi:hypothetical protein
MWTAFNSLRIRSMAFPVEAWITVWMSQERVNFLFTELRLLGPEKCSLAAVSSLYVWRRSMPRKSLAEIMTCLHLPHNCPAQCSPSEGWPAGSRGPEDCRTPHSCLVSWYSPPGFLGSPENSKCKISSKHFCASYYQSFFPGRSSLKENIVWRMASSRMLAVWLL